MAAVVSDTSVINYLAAVSQTGLLRDQFGSVFVPPAVWHELHARPGLLGTAAADEARNAGWLTVQKPSASEILARLSADLDPGEAEAIALALEFKPAIVLLDETEGRLAARAAGLQVIGTAGILVAARQSGQLRQIKPMLDRLMQDFRFRLSRELYEQLVAKDDAD